MIVTVVVPLWFPADGGSTGFDRAIESRVHSAWDAHTVVYRVLVFPSDGPVVVVLLFAGTAWFAFHRRWSRAAFTLLAPELAILVNSLVLKPLWDRDFHHYLAYPSGHTVHLVAVVTAFALATESPRVRGVTIAVMVMVLPAVTIGMVGFGYHHPTDVIGGTTAALAMVTALYLPFRHCRPTVRMMLDG